MAILTDKRLVAEKTRALQYEVHKLVNLLSTPIAMKLNEIAGDTDVLAAITAAGDSEKYFTNLSTRIGEFLDNTITFFGVDGVGIVGYSKIWTTGKWKGHTPFSLSTNHDYFDGVSTDTHTEKPLIAELLTAIKANFSNRLDLIAGAGAYVDRATLLQISADDIANYTLAPAGDTYTEDELALKNAAITKINTTIPKIAKVVQQLIQDLHYDVCQAIISGERFSRGLIEYTEVFAHTTATAAEFVAPFIKLFSSWVVSDSEYYKADFSVIKGAPKAGWITSGNIDYINGEDAELLLEMVTLNIVEPFKEAGDIIVGGPIGAAASVLFDHKTQLANDTGINLVGTDPIESFTYSQVCADPLDGTFTCVVKTDGTGSFDSEALCLAAAAPTECAVVAPTKSERKDEEAEAKRAEAEAKALAELKAKEEALQAEIKKNEEIANTPVNPWNQNQN